LINVSNLLSITVITDVLLENIFFFRLLIRTICALGNHSKHQGKVRTSHWVLNNQRQAVRMNIKLPQLIYLVN